MNPAAYIVFADVADHGPECRGPFCSEEEAQAFIKRWHWGEYGEVYELKQPEPPTSNQGQA